MNNHDIELPPLHYDDLPEHGDAIPAMHDYARKAIKYDRQQREELECEVRERGFLYENGKHTPTLLLAFPIDDWDGRDRMADSIAAAPKIRELV